MSDCKGTTNPASADGGSPPGPVQACPATAGSEILIVDELGLPLAGTSVNVRINGGAPTAATTDASGKICLSRPPGTSVQVDVVNIHEANPDDSTTTNSGKHFKTGGSGP